MAIPRIKGVLLLAFAILPLSGYAIPEQRTESFSAIPAWEGAGNQTSPQAFGVSPFTQNAGGTAPGEGGGYIERGAAAWFADSYLGSLDPTADAITFSASMTISNAGNPSFGY